MANGLKVSVGLSSRLFKQLPRIACRLPLRFAECDDSLVEVGTFARNDHFVLTALCAYRSLLNLRDEER